MVKRKTSPRRSVNVSNERTPSKSRTRSSVGVEHTRKQNSPKKRKQERVEMFVFNKRFKVLKSVLRQIKKLRRDTSLLIPKLPFSRLVREIFLDISNQNIRVQESALRALQEAAEIYLTQLFEDANKVVTHSKRITLKPNDLKLVLELRGCKDPGYSII